MEISDLKVLIPLLAFCGSIVAIFYKSIHNVKEIINEKNEKLVAEINALKIEIEKLKSRDELQQQVISTLQSQIDKFLPELFEIVKGKTKNGR